MGGVSPASPPVPQQPAVVPSAPTAPSDPNAKAGSGAPVAVTPGNSGFNDVDAIVEYREDPTNHTSAYFLRAHIPNGAGDAGSDVLIPVADLAAEDQQRIYDALKNAHEHGTPPNKQAPNGDTGPGASFSTAVKITNHRFEESNSASKDSPSGAYMREEGEVHVTLRAGPTLLTPYIRGAVSQDPNSDHAASESATAAGGKMTLTGDHALLSVGVEGGVRRNGATPYGTVNFTYIDVSVSAHLMGALGPNTKVDGELTFVDRRANDTNDPFYSEELKATISHNLGSGFSVYDTAGARVFDFDQRPDTRKDLRLTEGAGVKKELAHGKNGTIEASIGVSDTFTVSNVDVKNTNTVTGIAGISGKF